LVLIVDVLPFEALMMASFARTAQGNVSTAEAISLRFNGGSVSPDHISFFIHLNQSFRLLAFSPEPCLKGMNIIFAMRCPFQAAFVVVKFVAVRMINTFLPFWIWYEVFGNKSV
jgi:hypothetical protein